MRLPPFLYIIYAFDASSCFSLRCLFFATDAYASLPPPPLLIIADAISLMLAAAITPHFRCH